jgi:hypothetical protein
MFFMIELDEQEAVDGANPDLWSLIISSSGFYVSARDVRETALSEMLSALQQPTERRRVCLGKHAGGTLVAVLNSEFTEIRLASSGRAEEEPWVVLVLRRVEREALIAELRSAVSWYEC